MKQPLTKFQKKTLWYKKSKTQNQKMQPESLRTVHLTDSKHDAFPLVYVSFTPQELVNTIFQIVLNNPQLILHRAILNKEREIVGQVYVFDDIPNVTYDLLQQWRKFLDYHGDIRYRTYSKQFLLFLNYIGVMQSHAEAMSIDDYLKFEARNEFADFHDVFKLAQEASEDPENRYFVFEDKRIVVHKVYHSYPIPEDFPVATISTDYYDSTVVLYDQHKKLRLLFYGNDDFIEGTFVVPDNMQLSLHQHGIKLALIDPSNPNVPVSVVAKNYIGLRKEILNYPDKDNIPVEREFDLELNRSLLYDINEIGLPLEDISQKVDPEASLQSASENFKVTKKSLIISPLAPSIYKDGTMEKGKILHEDFVANITHAKTRKYGKEIYLMMDDGTSTYVETHTRKVTSLEEYIIQDIEESVNQHRSKKYITRRIYGLSAKAFQVLSRDSSLDFRLIRLEEGAGSLFAEDSRYSERVIVDTISGSDVVASHIFNIYNDNVKNYDYKEAKASVKQDGDIEYFSVTDKVLVFNDGSVSPISEDVAEFLDSYLTTYGSWFKDESRWTPHPNALRGSIVPDTLTLYQARHEDKPESSDARVRLESQKRETAQPVDEPPLLVPDKSIADLIQRFESLTDRIVESAGKQGQSYYVANDQPYLNVSNYGSKGPKEGVNDIRYPAGSLMKAGSLVYRPLTIQHVTGFNRGQVFPYITILVDERQLIIVLPIFANGRNANKQTSEKANISFRKFVDDIIRKSKYAAWADNIQQNYDSVTVHHANTFVPVPVQ